MNSRGIKKLAKIVSSTFFLNRFRVETLLLQKHRKIANMNSKKLIGANTEEEMESFFIR